MKLNTRQKNYLINIVESCTEKYELNNAFYNVLDQHHDNLERLGKPHELLYTTMGRFLEDYWNATKFTNYQF